MKFARFQVCSLTKKLVQIFRSWVFKSSNHPPNGYPNFEAIWRRFTEIGHHELPTYNGTTEIMIAERSDISHLHYKLEPHDDRSRWRKHLRPIFYSKNIHHGMSFRMPPGSHLKNPLYVELENIDFWLRFQHTSAFHFQQKNTLFFLVKFSFFHLIEGKNYNSKTQLASTQRFSKPPLKLSECW